MRVTEEVAKAKEKFVRDYLRKHPQATAIQVRDALVKAFAKLPKAARGMKPQTIGLIKKEMGTVTVSRKQPASRRRGGKSWFGSEPGPCVLPFRDQRERIMLEDLLSRLEESGLAKLKVDHVGDGYAVVVKS